MFIILSFPWQKYLAYSEKISIKNTYLFFFYFKMRVWVFINLFIYLPYPLETFLNFFSGVDKTIFLWNLKYFEVFHKPISMYLFVYLVSLEISILYAYVHMIWWDKKIITRMHSIQLFSENWIKFRYVNWISHS